jgi:sodium transport system permease protein
MPLFLVTLPLVALPMSPGFELTLGNCLIPLTGVMLILKSAIEGDYLAALRFILPVTLVTALCCLLAIRWAIDQFNKESVLFRESERFELGLWLKHLVRDRHDTPPVAAAILCGLVILTAKFFMELALVGAPGNMVLKTVVLQLSVVLAPAVLMTAILARSPRQTLLLRWPRWSTLPAVAALALLLHPVTAAAAQVVTWLYPVSPHLERAIEGLFSEMPSLWTQLLVIAVVAPLCEEIAFRGFILSGFRHLGRRWMAILLASVFFGATHGILQQSLVACGIGMVIGLVAVQTGSLLPAILYHMIHNGLGVVAGWLRSPNAELPTFLSGWQIPPVLASWLGTSSPVEAIYSWPVVVLCMLAAAALIHWFLRLPYEATPEERLQQALRGQSAFSAPGETTRNLSNLAS